MNIQHLPVLLQQVVTAMIIAVAITHAVATQVMAQIITVHPLHPIIADAVAIVVFLSETAQDAVPLSGFFCFSPAAVIMKHSIITIITVVAKALFGFFSFFVCAVTEEASAKNIKQSFLYPCEKFCFLS